MTKNIPKDIGAAIIAVLKDSNRLLPITAQDGLQHHCMTPEAVLNAVAGRYFSSEEFMDSGVYATTLQGLVEEGIIRSDQYPNTVVYDKAKSPGTYEVLVLQ